MSRTTDWSRAQRLEIGTGGRLCPGIRTVNAVQSRSERARKGASDVRVNRTVRCRATKTPSTTIETCESESIKRLSSVRVHARVSNRHHERSLERVDPRSRARRPRSREFLPSRALDARSRASKPAPGKKPPTRATSTRLGPSSTPVARARERFRARFHTDRRPRALARRRAARARGRRDDRDEDAPRVYHANGSRARARCDRGGVCGTARGRSRRPKRRGGRGRVANGHERSIADRGEPDSVPASKGLRLCAGGWRGAKRMMD